MNTIEVVTNSGRFVNLFNENKTKIENGLSGKINSVRNQALASFQAQNLPGKKIENYKYTDINSIFNIDFSMHFEPKKISFDTEEMFKCDVPNLNANTIILLNGFYFNKKEPIKQLPSGAIVGSLAEASAKYPELFEKHYGSYAKTDKEPLAALNTMFAQDGLFIYVPKNVVYQKPLQIINIALSNEDQFIQHRNLIILEQGSQFNIAVCDHTLSSNKFITNSVTEVCVGENAILDIVKIQNEHNGATQLSSTFAQQERNSKFSFNTISLHGGIIRNNSYIDLNGEGADNQTLGLFLADHNQHIDNYVYVNHAKPHCTSNQLFKGILDDKATGAFNGRIYVAKDAQQTQAYQSNNNILLTDDAKMHTKPQLEIYADDVKCSHGATVGQLDEDAFFYLRQRGIGEQEARMLLMFGFAHDIISRVQIEALRERIDDLVERRLRGELSRCNNCNLHCGESC